MFESSQFLDIYLPEYFLKVFDRNYSNQSNKKIPSSPLQVVSQFVKFSHSLYAAQNFHKQFLCFLLKQFPFLDNAFNSKSLRNQNSCEINKGKILEFIELNLDKINQMFIELYIKIFHINLLTKDNSFHKLQIGKHCEEILKDLTHIRLIYQIQRFQTSNLKEFDDYIIEVFKLLLEDDITKDMEIIIKKLLSDECSNVNEGTIQQIQQLFNKQEKQALKIMEKNEQRSNLIFLRANLAKKHKKIEKSKTQCTLKKTQAEENHFSSPSKTDKKKQTQSYSPINRIKNYMRNKKEKAINKKRTIYFERKNVHQPKVKEWIDKISFFSSQLTLTSQLDKKTEKKLFRLQPSQSTLDDYDNESVLVRSTPKPNKKYSMGKMISHKLDF